MSHIATQADLDRLDEFLIFKMAQASGSLAQTSIVEARQAQLDLLRVGDALPYELAQLLAESHVVPA